MIKYLTGLMALILYTSVQATPMTLGNILSTSYSEIDTGEGVFRLTDTADAQNDATAFLFFESAGYANINTFGIVGADLTTLEIFDGASSPTTSSTLSWDVNTNIITNLTTMDSALIDDQLFSFYLESGDGNTYFSVSSMNPNSLDMMLSYDVSSSGYPALLGSDYILAWEDVGGGDQDYNDLVIGLSDVGAAGVPTLTTTEVPEPSTVALMLLSLGLLGYTTRR